MREKEDIEQDMKSLTLMEKLLLEILLDIRDTLANLDVYIRIGNPYGDQ